jgi:hypothetical protein
MGAEVLTATVVALGSCFGYAAEVERDGLMRHGHGFTGVLWWLGGHR